MFKKTTFNWLENGSGWVDSRNRKKEWIYVTVVALFPLLSFSRWKKNLDCNFKRNDSTFCFQRRKKNTMLKNISSWLLLPFAFTWYHNFFHSRHNVNILLVMVVSIAMHMYLSATLLRYLETWILHQKHFKMNCFIETGLKSCSILRKCFVIQEILNSHNTMPGCIGWFCRQSKIDPKYCSR